MYRKKIETDRCVNRELLPRHNRTSKLKLLRTLQAFNAIIQVQDVFFHHAYQRYHNHFPVRQS